MCAVSLPRSYTKEVDIAVCMSPITKSAANISTLKFIDIPVSIGTCCYLMRVGTSVYMLHEVHFKGCFLVPFEEATDSVPCIHRLRYIRSMAAHR